MELWAAIESDRMQNAVLREFYTELKVVKEERRRSYDAEPEGKLWETFIADAFNAHPNGQPTIGWMSDIENLTRTKAERFLHKYYAPNNAIVAIVGDIDPAEDHRAGGEVFRRHPAGNPGAAGGGGGARTGGREADRGGGRRRAGADDRLPQADPSRAGRLRLRRDRHAADQRPDLAPVQEAGAGEAAGHSVSSFSAPGSRYPNLFILERHSAGPAHREPRWKQAIYQELDRLKNEPMTDRNCSRS